MKEIRSNDRIWFGKHKGSRLIDVIKQDPTFIQKLIKNGKFKLDDKSAYHYEERYGRLNGERRLFNPGDRPVRWDPETVYAVSSRSQDQPEPFFEIGEAQESNVQENEPQWIRNADTEEHNDVMRFSSRLAQPVHELNVLRILVSHIVDSINQRINIDERIKEHMKNIFFTRMRDFIIETNDFILSQPCNFELFYDRRHIERTQLSVRCETHESNFNLI